MVETEDNTTATVAATSRNGGSVVIDQTIPFFLHASDSPGMTLVHTTFDGNGYGAWRRSMLIALSAKNKLGYIEGSSLVSAPESVDFKLWSMSNDIVTSWLLNSLSKEIAGSKIYSKSAKELWKDLEDSCGGKEKMNKSLQDERKKQHFDDDTSAQCHLAHSLLMQDKRQRESYMNTNFPGNSTSFLAAQHYYMGQRSPNSDCKGKKSNLMCLNCKKPRHAIDKCYRIIGFPSDFNFTKSSRTQGLVKSNAVVTASGQTSNEGYQGG
ncbi:hypothetical protein KY290_031376 [Solanum tuberosum]|uniref:Retrotransposon Copia-like N-terminal domain-containing protein n=1 Tax=Solanum tuberosum TaxID=4113 RepID=A0ABQ7U988_SOLTU|nr:hypothetical protein KY289_030766 [Solanum tuberosum]KAH0743383.1 hypothetical protein KY290_031376 [Solanum tuberosum]